MKFIKSLDTVKCTICVYDTEMEFMNTKIYCIASYHRCNGELNVRFGNKEQIESMVNSYVPKRA